MVLQNERKSDKQHFCVYFILLKSDDPLDRNYELPNVKENLLFM